jgi:hypothetical protein
LGANTLIKTTCAHLDDCFQNKKICLLWCGKVWLVKKKIAWKSMIFLFIENVQWKKEMYNVNDGISLKSITLKVNWLATEHLTAQGRQAGSKDEGTFQYIKCSQSGDHP